MSFTVYRLLSGFINFRKDIRIAGVIFNKVGSPKHFQILQQVCDDLGIRCFGYLPKNPVLEQGSRYLGLDFSQRPETRQLLELIESHVNWEELVQGLSTHCMRPLYTLPHYEISSVLVARNEESFSFLYQEVLDRFPHILFFDPERDVPSLDGVDLIYLPGGYPEKHLDALVSNEACRMAIKAYAEQGGHIIAECGGMMYLCKSIVTEDGAYPMCGVLPYSITARRADRKLSLGYRRFFLDGKEYRGHEFHYTQFLGETPKSVVQVYNARGETVDKPVFRLNNVLSSYTHLYQI